MRVTQNWTVFVIIFLIGTITATAQYNSNYELPRIEQEEDLSAFKRPAQYRRVLMIQNKSPEARSLAIKANNWRKASNITYGIAVTGFLTSLVMANNAGTDDQSGEALGIGVSSLITASIGFFFHSLYTHNLYKAIDIYIKTGPENNDPSELTLQLSVNFQLGN